ncbi:MAG TPA: pyruvate, phosphate dikinase [bacterium]|nr:pyruvate, phosphate dikinase [bacterium]
MPKVAEKKKSSSKSKSKPAATAKGKKFVYFFGNGKAEGEGTMKDVLGGKGAGLAEMTNAGVPVPPGFTITTETCRIYYESGKKVPEAIDKEMQAHLARLEKALGKKFGDKNNPLLVSVRSGAKFSMPGMMDTILNLGMNDETIKGVIANTNNERFAWDSYRRFVQMYGNVVLDMGKEVFERVIDKMKEEKGVKLDTELTAADLKELVEKFKKLIKDKTGKEFPQDVMAQLRGARDAVFRSWMNDRAIYYRKQNDIPANIGTAVNVQSMVFGNMGDDSGTGVGFTRNPATGEKKFYGEYLLNAQGEDVVAGIRTPQPIAQLEKDMPKVFKQLYDTTKKLEKHYRDIQDFEFTIEKGKLFMLQTRTGKRTAAAAVKIAIDLVNEKLITKEEALQRVEPIQLDQLLHPVFDTKAKKDVITKGLPASPGAASGQAVFTADAAVEWKSEGKKVILVRLETSPDDIHGMDAAEGILTARGGMTSHAAVVARGMGKTCVAGCESIRVDEHGKKFSVGSTTVKEGDWISLNGSTGEVINGKVPTMEAELSGDFATLMGWADAARTLKVRANADIPRDAKVARNFGAEGIGLCRTEHMFFDEDRLPHMQAMILATDEASRREALKKLLPMQKSDFLGLFEAMEGYPVTVRFLDPPLHEFLPKREELMVEIAKMEASGKTLTSNEIIKKALELVKENGSDLQKAKSLLHRVEELHEFNPMLGHRGCRLGITYPEITEMQTEAVISAACELVKKGKKIVPEIMIPLVGDTAELKNQKAIVIKKADETIAKYGVKLEYLIGTMIELPRAAVTADKIGAEADFFSFGTNDLTQTTFGFSRDDTAKIIRYYQDNGIYEKDPFQVLDRNGVGQLVKMGVEKGRSVKPKLKVGICGEHGGDPNSVEFCHMVGLNYVSCSPYRVPIARLAAAQAAIRHSGKGKEYSSK